MLPKDPEIELRIREIMQECERRIREHFEAQQEHGDLDESFGSLKMYFDPDLARIIVQGNHVALEGNPETQMMERITCAGALYIDRLFVNGLLEDFRPQDTMEGTALMIFDAEHQRVLGLHDNPRCVLNVAASAQIPSITMDLADHLELERAEGGDLRFSDGAVEGVVLLHGAKVVVGEGNQLTITGKATFMLKKAGTSANLGGSRYLEAIEAKKVGGEVRIEKGEKGLDYAAVPIGDLEINVTGNVDGVLAIIDSPAGIGKTVVLEITAEVFLGKQLRVLVMDENGSDLDAIEADSLDDVLDPHDDGEEGIEFWIVQDKNGFHVLVSFAHFSEKRVSIESDGAVPEGPFQIPGFGTGLLLGSLVLAAAIACARRRVA